MYQDVECNKNIFSRNFQKFKNKYFQEFSKIYFQEYFQEYFRNIFKKYIFKIYINFDLLINMYSKKHGYLQFKR